MNIYYIELFLNRFISVKPEIFKKQIETEVFVLFEEKFNAGNEKLKLFVKRFKGKEFI